MRESNDERVVRGSFRDIRRRALLFGALPSGLAIILILGIVWLDQGKVLGIGRAIWFGVCAVLFGGGMLYCYLEYRCPRCDALLLTAGVAHGGAFDFSIEKCPACGLNLK